MTDESSLWLAKGHLNMQVSWEPKDIHGGQRLFKTAVIEEEWMIGYTVGAPPQGHYHIISLLDGNVANTFSGTEIPTDIKRLVEFNGRE